MFVLATVAAEVLTSFLSSILGEAAKYHIGNLWNADKNLRDRRASLDKQLLELRETLRYIDGSLVHSGMPSDWLDELERCRYEIEDIQESIGLAAKKEIVAKLLDTITKYATMMQRDLANMEHGMVAGLSNKPLTNFNSEFLADEHLISRGEDKTKIIEELTTTTTNGVSVIGIGGMGKTILAKAIATEASIKGFFPCILSPPQSLNFNSKTVLDFIENAGLPSKDERVLILLDGLHSVDPEVWRHFQRERGKILNSESRVLITTQNPRVADVTGTSKYCLPPLLGENCISLIRDIANGNRNLHELDDHDIRRNEEDLVDTCKGLPLLAIQIGLLISAAAPEHRLRTIIDITASSSWKVPGLQRVLVSLKPVSLIVQQPNLRRCLAYFSLFPQNYEFQEDNLVEFWMAEGFTRPSRDASYLEQTARGYFDELLSYSLFQTSASLHDQKPRYKLHGLFYDMALNVASRTFCHIGNSIPSPEISNITRHFSLRCENANDIDTDPLLVKLHSLCGGLRTFLLVNESGKKIRKNPTFFHGLKCLRVLDLSHTNLTKLEPKRISELKYLRYLDLSFTPVEDLPKLSKSPELQVLKLNYCDNLRQLPPDLTKLTSLISLQVNRSGLASLPSRIGKLTTLQRLEPFTVGKKEGFKITELSSLNDLRYSLRITKLENVETKQEAQEAKLCNKRKLERIELEWSSSAPNAAAVQVLQGLEPSKNLEELKIKNYCSAKFPEWLSKTGSLKSIHLNRCTALPSTDQIPQLKSLCVEAMHEKAHELSGRNRTSGGFPFIEILILCDMPQLTGWKELAANYMPKLCNLRVEKCQSDKSNKVLPLQFLGKQVDKRREERERRQREEEKRIRVK